MADWLGLSAVVTAIERPDAAARAATEESRPRPPGSPGRLDDLAGWLSGVQGESPARPLQRVRLVVLAGDHGVAAQDVSRREPGATAELVRGLVDGSAPVSGLAAALDVGVRVVAMSVDDELADLPAAVTQHATGGVSGDVQHEPALTRAQAIVALQAGIALVDQEVDAGADLLVVADVGRGAGIPAAALVGLLTRNDASAVTSKGASIDDALWMRRCAAVRDTMRRGRPVLGDHLELLAQVGGADLAAMTGLLLQAAVRRTPVLLDGVVTAAAALLAQRIAFRATDWWAAAHRSPEPAHDVALERLDLRPLLDLGIRQEDGAGALLAVPVLRAAAVLG